MKNIKQPKIDNVNNNVSTYENHRHVVIGPSNVDKTYYLLKILEKIDNKRPIHIITRSPNQYPNYKTSNEIKPINKYSGSVIVFDDMIYDEFKEMCRVACSEKFNYLYIDMTKNKNEGKYRIFNESKNTYIECVCETEAF